MPQSYPTSFAGNFAVRRGVLYSPCGGLPRVRLLDRSTVMDIIRIILSVILPPLGVFLQVGLGMHFWLNILLTLLGYFPGLIHAIYIIASRNRA